MRSLRFVLTTLVAGAIAAASPAQLCCTGNVSTYCTAGTSVQGCLPQISGVGVPSADAANGFQITVGSVPAQRQGLVFYGFYAANQPWAPFSPSYLCVAPPVQRTGAMSSGGNFGQCNGQLGIDFNAWRVANPTALGYPFAPGQTIRAQGWFRDPGAPSQTNLSDALVFNLCAGTGDITPPVITTCAGNQTVGTLAACHGVVPDFTASVVANDNCSAVTITQLPAVGASAPLGVTTVTITATDAAGNRTHCVATLTVADTTGPVITVCAQNQTVPANSNCQAVVPDFTTGVVASDACGGAVTLSQSPPAGTLTNMGAAMGPITITASDALGNISICSSTLTITQGMCAVPSGFVPIQQGTFQVGSNATSAPYYGGADEQPVHQVTISYTFWMGATEVTQGQYAALMGANPSHFSGVNSPVEGVSWLDAQAYCAALTAQQSSQSNLPAGYEYRLPTEAEWEYACRAGTTTEFNVGSALHCNHASFGYSYHSNSSCNSGCPVQVGSYTPNAWGLHDMHGNVREWCIDSYAAYSAVPVTDPFVTGGSLRIIRGGSWRDATNVCRSAYRDRSVPDFAGNFIGFRVVLAPVLIP